MCVCAWRRGNSLSWAADKSLSQSMSLYTKEWIKSIQQFSGEEDDEKRLVG